jgi:site-specific DNA-methyltransferase (adenine-specific)
VDTNANTEDLITREYLEKEKICLVCGDCLDVMLKIETKSVDLILCDLPYGVTKNKWDIIIPFDKLWEQYNRIIKDNGAIVLFGSQPFTTAMISSNMKHFRYCLVWEKNKFSDFLNAKRKPMKTNEDICIFYKKQPTYNILYWYSSPYERWNTQSAVDRQSNYGTHKENVSVSDGRRLPTTVLKFNRVERPAHPTQKPVDLLEWLIKSYTNEGETVLDNCMGVGSTGIAAIKNNRRFIGIELNEEYYNKALEFIQIQKSIVV